MSHALSKVFSITASTLALLNILSWSVGTHPHIHPSDVMTTRHSFILVRHQVPILPRALKLGN